MSERIGSLVMLELVKSELKLIGFDGVQGNALEEISAILTIFYQNLLENVNLKALEANRTSITVKDVTQTLESYNITIDSLIEHIHSTPPSDTLTLTQPTPPTPPLQPLTLAQYQPALIPPHLIDSFLPPLPPSHSYKTTPVYPIQQSSILNNAILLDSPTPLQPPNQIALKHISTIRSRLLNSKKVSNSLRNLINSTSLQSIKSNNSITVEEVINFEPIWYNSTSATTTAIKRKWKV